MYRKFAEVEKQQFGRGLDSSDALHAGDKFRTWPSLPSSPFGGFRAVFDKMRSKASRVGNSSYEVFLNKALRHIWD